MEITRKSVPKELDMQDRPDNHDDDNKNGFDEGPQESGAGSEPPIISDTPGDRPVPPPYTGTRPGRRPVPYTTGRNRRPVPRQPDETTQRPIEETRGGPGYTRRTRTAGETGPNPDEYTRRRRKPSSQPLEDTRRTGSDERTQRRKDGSAGPERTTRHGYTAGPESTTRPRSMERPGNAERPERQANEYPVRRNPNSENEENHNEALYPSSRRRPRRRARRRTQFAAMYIFIIVISVGIAMTAFATAFPRIFDPERQAARAAAAPTPSPTPTPLPVNARNLTGLVTGISGQDVSFLDISRNNARTLEFVEDTDLRNRFGQPMEFEDLAVGSLMDIAYNPDSSELFSLRQAITDDLTPADFRVDTEYSTITVGNRVLNFSEQTLVLRRGSPFPLENIQPEYLVTFVTLSDMIWTIDVESAHGFLQFTNADAIVDGRVIANPIGPGINRFGDVAERMTLPEGMYRITVEGRNIEAYVTEVTIVYGETTTVDLSEVDLGVAVLELTVTPSGSAVYINGVRTSISAPIEFEFGDVLQIRVEREGYYTEERTVEMNLSIVSINITLEEETPEVVTATLTISTQPSAAQVWVNGQFIGFGPVITELYPGNISVVVIAEGYFNYETHFNVYPGENNRSIFMTRMPEDPPEYVPVPTPPPEDYPEPPWEPPPAYDPDDGDDGASAGYGD